MKLAIIGSGNIGKSIGKWAAKVGYEVDFSAKNMDHARDAARAAGNDSGYGTVSEIVKDSDMILLAVPYGAVKEVISNIQSNIEGKIIIDATNALKPDYSGLMFGLTTSAAEEIQKLVPEARVVKAFNAVFAKVFDSQDPEIEGKKVAVFYASDDKAAKEKVAELINQMGFDAVDAGPLSSSRNLEPLALLNVNLGYGQGLGTSIGFALLR